jgi:MarR family transcriptional regulator, lower aerobic nicotinate degradation pathway regulator
MLTISYTDDVSEAPAATSPATNLTTSPVTTHPAELTAWMGFLLRQAALLAQRQTAAALEPLGLRPPHNTIMTLLAAGPRSQATLAAQTHTDRTTMVAIVDDLEQLQLLQRLPNPNDRRAFEVTLTDLGQQRLTEAREAMQKADQAITKRLSSEEVEQLRQLLLRVLE